MVRKETSGMNTYPKMLIPICTKLRHFVSRRTIRIRLFIYGYCCVPIRPLANLIENASSLLRMGEGWEILAADRCFFIFMLFFLFPRIKVYSKVIQYVLNSQIFRLSYLP